MTNDDLEHRIRNLEQQLEATRRRLRSSVAVTALSGALTVAIGGVLAYRIATDDPGRPLLIGHVAILPDGIRIMGGDDGTTQISAGEITIENSHDQKAELSSGALELHGEGDHIQASLDIGAMVTSHPQLLLVNRAHKIDLNANAATTEIELTHDEGHQVSIQASQSISGIIAAAGEASAELSAASIKTPIARNFAVVTAKLGQRAANVLADADHAGLETRK